MKTVIRLVLLIALAGALAVGGFWLLRSRESPQERAAEAEPTATVERRDIDSNLLLTGEVTPAFQLEIRAEVGGKIKTIHAEVGEFVRAGDPLITIDDRDLQSERATVLTQIEGARLAEGKSRGNYERAKALFESKLISREVFANLEADFAISSNALEQAERRLEVLDERIRKTRILAPADGTVLTRPVIEGQVVTAAGSVNSGTSLMNFANLGKLMIFSHVNQADAPRLSLGLPVEINVADGAEQPVSAHIEFIAPLATVKNNVKGFEVKAAIDDSEGRLKPGMSVSMSVPVGRAAGAISVPVAAIFRDQRKSVVYVLKDGVPEKRQVKVGITDLSFAEIKAGVREGEQILLVEPPDTPAKG